MIGIPYCDIKKKLNPRYLKFKAKNRPKRPKFNTMVNRIAKNPNLKGEFFGSTLISFAFVYAFV